MLGSSMTTGLAAACKGVAKLRELKRGLWLNRRLYIGFTED